MPQASRQPALAALSNLAMYGYIGVDWFFIISGFVIAWTAQGRDALTFAVSRFARIYPGYIACMTLTFVLTVTYGWQHASPELVDWIANLSTVCAAAWPSVHGWRLLVDHGGNHLLRLGFPAAWPPAFGTSVSRLLPDGWPFPLLNMVFLKSEALRMVLITEYAPHFAIGIMMFDMRERGPRIVTACIHGNSICCCVSVAHVASAAALSRIMAWRPI